VDGYGLTVKLVGDPGKCFVVCHTYNLSPICGVRNRYAGTVTVSLQMRVAHAGDGGTGAGGRGAHEDRQHNRCE